MLKSTESIYTPESYLKALEFWSENQTSSSGKENPEYVRFTKLNLARTRRIHQNLIIKVDLKRWIINLMKPLSWVILTESWCGDSAQNLPLILDLAALNPQYIDVQIFLRDQNLDLMEHYLTHGTRSIPKMIVRDNHSLEDLFIWGPRPLPAQKILENWKSTEPRRSWDEFEHDLHAWYAKDKTQTLQDELFLKFQDFV